MYPFDLSFPFLSFALCSYFNLYFVNLILINLLMKLSSVPVSYSQTCTNRAAEINIWPLHGQTILVGLESLGL